MHFQMKDYLKIHFLAHILILHIYYALRYGFKFVIQKDILRKVFYK